MKRLIVYTILITGGLSFGWKYLPQDARDKTTAFVGNVLRGQSQVSDVVTQEEALPSDPEEKRAVLIDRLKNNLGELKNTITTPAVKKSSALSDKQNQDEMPQVRDNAETLFLLTQSDQLLKRLEEANTDVTFGREIINRTLEVILPEKKQPTIECPK